MTKRIRRQSPEVRGRSRIHSSPSSDSQDGMADTEQDIRRSQKSETLQSSTVPPKKKRTRTLTTPHQSAVLHELLAKSRFPTTAMREEVGRSIGLSARKVQIWFQNQRQKARRPRAQNDPSRPPQYGPFSSLTDPHSGATAPHQQYSTAIGTPSAQRYAEEMHSYRLSGPRSPEMNPPQRGYSVPLEQTAHLLGPGMPGSDTPPIYQTGARPTSGSPLLPIFNRTHSDHDHPHFGGFPARHDHRDTSRTLPPLVFEPRARQPAIPINVQRNTRLPSPPFGRTLPLISNPTSPTAHFAFHPPEGPTRSPLAIPPPFTLEPRPHWGNDTFPLGVRPTSSAWSHSGSQSTRENSPHSRHDVHPDTETSLDAGGEHSSEAQPSQRSGRYDPVRAMFIPRPDPSDSPPTARESTP
ncbi:hypothetical protein BD779DRAFT_1674041 [Infundibulicybe gibba]|nr:hypothetical protein BD779DRAFT_1674041 [Infundibulicybe gibba]